MTTRLEGAEREQAKRELDDVNADLNDAIECRESAMIAYDRMIQRLRDEQSRLNAKVYAA